MMFKNTGRRGDGLIVFQAPPNQLSAILDKFAVRDRECRREMTVNVEFAGHLAAHKDGNHNLGLGFERASKIA
jgi:hypothetical protein